MNMCVYLCMYVHLCIVPDCINIYIYYIYNIYYKYIWFHVFE